MFPSRHSLSSRITEKGLDRRISTVAEAVLRRTLLWLRRMKTVSDRTVRLNHRRCAPLPGNIGD